MLKAAHFSPCRTWRYSLSRWLVPDPKGPPLVVIGLNPSTADETVDDPTIRRCIGFARTWKFEALMMVNLFAFRATQPRDMRQAPDPYGPENDEVLDRVTAGAFVLCAWGNGGTHLEAGAWMRWRLRGTAHAHHLGLTTKGQPRHPLYVHGEQRPIPWDGDAGPVPW